MFLVRFRDANRDSDLTKSMHLPAIPSVGEPVYIRELPHHRPQTGRVASRHWHIATKEIESSEVVILVTLD